MYNVLSGIHDIISRLASHPTNDNNPKAQSALLLAANQVLNARNFHPQAGAPSPMGSGMVNPQPNPDSSTPGVNRPVAKSPYDRYPMMNGRMLQGGYNSNPFKMK